MNWDQIVEKITPHIVKIETQSGHGTGFLSLYNEDQIFCGIATALHVVSHADKWQQPIRILHYSSGETVLLEENDRVIYMDWETDSAILLFPKDNFPFLPEQPEDIFPNDSIINIGVEVGWLGFPAVVPYKLCFFSGKISALREYSSERYGDRNAYLIDGVAINGVSGGPVIYSNPADGIQIVGTITAYLANRATGESLPGLSVAQDVSHFHEVASEVQSIDEANKKKAELEISQQTEKELENGEPPTSQDSQNVG